MSITLTERCALGTREFFLRAIDDLVDADPRQRLPIQFRMHPRTYYMLMRECTVADIDYRPEAPRNFHGIPVTFTRIEGDGPWAVTAEGKLVLL